MTCLHPSTAFVIIRLLPNPSKSTVIMIYTSPSRSPFVSCVIIHLLPNPSDTPPSPLLSHDALHSHFNLMTPLTPTHASFIVRRVLSNPFTGTTFVTLCHATPTQLTTHPHFSQNVTPPTTINHILYHLMPNSFLISSHVL